jgi:ATP-dependent helicase/nuclease subunit B
LAEVRQALRAAPDGPPLVFIAPKQTTYQLERQLLADPEIPGYARLQIRSFERLADLIFERLRKAPPKMLEEEGRLMVLRGLLSRKREDLRLFRASARLTGFARQLSLLLREFQRHQLNPPSLNALAARVRGTEGLAYKLLDLALLQEAYLDWLKTHRLLDAESLLTAATEALLEGAEGGAEHSGRAPASAFRIEHVWVDGFTELSLQEIELLAALIPRCDKATITFCLDEVPTEKSSWLSTWSVVRQTFEKCRRRLEQLPGASVGIELIERHEVRTRFRDNRVLQHLERFWAAPEPYPSGHPPPSSALRAARCVHPEAEVTLAAREILAHVRAGGRYRDITVLVRRLEGYHQPLQRVFTRYGIPFFLDRRESVSHHPLAELTRSALRTLAFQWDHEDWFAALKTGLVSRREKEIDELENEALARGWKGAVWHQPIRFQGNPNSAAEAQRLRVLEAALEKLRQEIVPPFERLELALAARQNRPTGSQLAEAILAFWKTLDVESRLREWAEAPIPGSNVSVPGSVHATVWDEMNAWLENLELGFPDEALPLREWLPILEAGLANLTVGVIPPALDQVLIGAVDRSRDPEVKLALVLGLNETVFPAPPETPILLSPADHDELERHGLVLGANTRLQLSRERYYAYVACTRSRERLVLTSALHGPDSAGSRLNPSPFLSHIQQLFPTLRLEVEPPRADWRDSQHPAELIVPLLERQSPDAPFHVPRELCVTPALASLVERLRHFQQPLSEESLAPALAQRLYGSVLRTSVSRMEHFAACPFKFFVNSGLRAEERKLFELDVRERGSFQHDVLAFFHEELRRENKRWRDITPIEARQRIARIAEAFIASFRDGLLQASEQSRFMAGLLSASLQDFVETLVAWMRGQYRFDPVAVELPFGANEGAPAWDLDLGNGRRLALRGRIDRVDVCPQPDHGSAWCVVVDYKSSQKKLDSVLVANGLQLQLLAYLNVVRAWPNPEQIFGASRLTPAGVFYVNLRGRFESARNRREALEDPEQARNLAYQHTGRFDINALRWLDARLGAKAGNQFNYRRKNDGELNKGSREALQTRQFDALLDSVSSNLQKMGRQIFFGMVKVDPFRKGSVTACQQCDYRSICRIDPWTHLYRILRKAESEPVEAEDDEQTTANGAAEQP